jgi:hypothetical protein
MNFYVETPSNPINRQVRTGDSGLILVQLHGVTLHFTAPVLSIHEVTIFHKTKTYIRSPCCYLIATRR